MTGPKHSELNVKDVSFINDIKNLAVIGPSKKRDYYFFKNHAIDFKGNAYAVHPTVKEISGFDRNKIVPSLKDIKEDIDYAWISLPASQVLNVIDECIDKGVKLVTIFSSDFSDSGTEKGLILEQLLVKRAQNKVRILGPNGMGLYYPKLGICWRSNFPTTAGNIGFIAQSGGMCNIAIYGASSFGIKFSKVFSFGNGADLDLVDLLYFLSEDPETDIILCYLEGIKEGRIDDLRKVLEHNKKPVICLKGGQSKSGSIAAKTHTASISGNNKLWNAFFKQYNVIQVDSLEQLLHTAHILDCYKAFEINNLAVASISGGYGVVLVDLLAKNGFNIPQFSSDIQKQLNSRFILPGTSPKNPLDLAAHFFFENFIYDVLNIALSDINIDGLVLDMPSFYLTPVFTRSRYNTSFESIMIESLSLGHKYNKPVIPIIQRLNRPDDRERVRNILIEKKVPVFGVPDEFIPILRKISEYKKKLKKKSKNV
ncbi:MAG: CoA-binding protein [Candidatus Lokiarchaeota archaeon]|nr:CoA-binding protein [Candidatus Lokiarchaeota archaeon]